MGSSLLLRYGLALGSASVAFVVGLILWRFTGDLGPFALFAAALIVSAWYAGVGPALVCSAVALVADGYFIQSSAPAFVMPGPRDLSRVGLFGLLTVLVSWLCGGRRQAEAALRGDIAERRRVEAERAESLVREQAARGEAEAANRAMDEFLATVSHELRTPLTAILGWLQVLRTAKPDTETFARALATIERNAKVQAHLVDELLDVSRMISGKLTLEIHPDVHLAPIIEAALDALGPMAKAKEIQLESRLDVTVPAVTGDADRLRQVVSNLLGNALKFTPNRGRVEVRLARTEGHVQITVRDTGEGIPAHVLPYIFDRWRQADSAQARGGLGLGLAIVRHLVHEHGGIVYAESPGQGQGATFTVKLPIPAVHITAVEARSSRLAIASGPPPVGGSLALSGVRVLLVEDEADTRELLTIVLTQHGAEVTPAASAGDALEALERAQPDVLLADIGLGDEDGYALIRRVRARPAARGGHLPAVALTAYARSEDRARVLSAGFQVHLAKPVEPAALVAVLADVTRRSGEGGVPASAA